jgi:hypothetical protein
MRVSIVESNETNMVNGKYVLCPLVFFHHKQILFGFKTLLKKKYRIKMHKSMYR